MIVDSDDPDCYRFVVLFFLFFFLFFSCSSFLFLFLFLFLKVPDSQKKKKTPPHHFPTTNSTKYIYDGNVSQLSSDECSATLMELTNTNITTSEQIIVLFNNIWSNRNQCILRCLASNPGRGHKVTIFSFFFLPSLFFPSFLPSLSLSLPLPSHSPPLTLFLPPSLSNLPPQLLLMALGNRLAYSDSENYQSWNNPTGECQATAWTNTGPSTVNLTEEVYIYISMYM